MGAEVRDPSAAVPGDGQMKSPRNGNSLRLGRRIESLLKKCLESGPYRKASMLLTPAQGSEESSCMTHLNLTVTAVLAGLSRLL